MILNISGRSYILPCSLPNSQQRSLHSLPNRSCSCNTWATFKERYYGWGREGWMDDIYRQNTWATFKERYQVWGREGWMIGWMIGWMDRWKAELFMQHMGNLQKGDIRDEGKEKQAISPASSLCSLHIAQINVHVSQMQNLPEIKRSWSSW